MSGLKCPSAWVQAARKSPRLGEDTRHVPLSGPLLQRQRPRKHPRAAHRRPVAREGVPRSRERQQDSHQREEEAHPEVRPRRRRQRDRAGAGRRRCYDSFEELDPAAQRLLSALFILVGALSYPLEIDRASTSLSPSWSLRGAWAVSPCSCFISGAGLGLGVRARPQKATAPSRRPGGRIGRVMDYQAPASQASYDPHAQRANPWHQEIMTQARALRLEPGGRLQLERQGRSWSAPRREGSPLHSVLAQLIPLCPPRRGQWQAPGSGSSAALAQGIFRSRPPPSRHGQ